ncbi:Serine hydrolase FSH [Penicillium bovifimosum]|uniref:Serine hydrolase FSH n=1 Tax=Penicillium bovifimosum TaxID=126998 RepID=A0A9W9GM81_9EURO|nr:Serine hydrolase FSH [Penicillium bovifimosum]KAJ5124218.1 Serine hydrolase FSH [Penicillium bovifimosum]
MYKTVLTSNPLKSLLYKPTTITTRHLSTMGSNGTSTRQPLKLLMLHGYTQSGSLFHAKSRALTKHIQKAFPLHEVTPIYPTGPLRLRPADIPGYEPSTTGTADEEIESYAWWRRSNTAKPPLYIDLEEGLASVARTLQEEGPFDGVIGFSQGAALAAMVASLLEPGRKESFEHFSKIAVDGAAGMEMPAPFGAEGFKHPQLKFAVCYSGFRAPGPRYRAFYEEPAIQTPVLHVLGSLDAVVEEARSRALVEACAGEPEKDGSVVWHPGGHFLPSQRPYLDAVVRFIREKMEGSDGKGKEVEEDVNDMDMPF